MKNQFLRIIGIAVSIQLCFSAYAQDINLSKYRVVTHSSSFDVNQCGHLVVDGNRETYWESFWNRKKPDAPQWLLIDLGDSREVNKVSIDWGTNYALKYSVTISQERNAQGNLLFQTEEGNGGLLEIPCKGVAGRYVRVDIQKNLDPYRGAVIKEIEVFGIGPDRFVPSKVLSLSANSRSLNGKHWRVNSSRFVDEQGADVSTDGFDDTQWIPAKVPGTVMGDYYNFGALPDPLYGDNIHQISDEFFSGNNFWYRSSLDFDKDLRGKRLFIDFSGINWKSEVYFNGKRLGQIDGGFMRSEFEVTEYINFDEPNALAVLVYHNDNWVSGEFKVIRKSLGHRVTNGDMLGLDGPTSLASAGWNWLPIIPGRNNGIWNNVELRIQEDVSIVDPWVSTTLSLPDTTSADLVIRTALKNHTDKSINGKLVAEYLDQKIELDVSLAANEVKQIELNKTQFSELMVKNPKLWWPNGYGEQNLHSLLLKFFQSDEVLSDTEEINFGIRHLEYKVENEVLFVYCNGIRILLKGGNWGLPEAMMRCDSADYDLRVLLHKEANFNMIRNWIGMTNREEFYDACDRYGILIFDDFWLANPKNGPDPRDFDLFMSNAKDKIKWVRKHPSLAFYCGRNEGLPLLKYDVAMLEETIRLDGTRHYVPHSAAGTVSGFGPYDVRSVDYYFRRRGHTLHSEQGIIAIPEIESLRRMMPKENLWPINDMWAIHNYQTGRSEKFTETIVKRFGQPTSAEDYSRRAQLWNYESAKAMFESLQSNQGSGMILWMSQSAWPSLICQLYDHYFEYTASYFAAKKASSSIHVFWDKYRNEIRAANNSKEDLDQVNIQAQIFDSKGNMIWEEKSPTKIQSTSVVKAFNLPKSENQEVRFLKLRLSKEDQILSENFYWIENSEGNCLDLNDLPTSKVGLKVKGKTVDGAYTAKIKLINNSKYWSLLNKIKVKDKTNGESILPVFFDDDYVSLMPGEERTLIMRVDQNLIENKNIQVHLEGWNTQPLVVDLK